MVPKFIYSSKDNPCPICGRTKDSDCRISHNGSLVLCHKNFGEKCPDDWHYVKPTDDDRCGVFVKKYTKTERPWGQTFEHFYISFNNNQHTLIRHYKENRTGKQCKWDKPLGNEKESELCPYKWEEIKGLDEVFICEGELKVDDLWDRGLPATTCRVWSDRQAELFKGKTCVILPDCDRTGIKKAMETAELLTKHGAKVKYCYLPRIGNWEYPPNKDGLDSYDYFQLGGTIADLRSHITDQPLTSLTSEDESEDSPTLHCLTNYDKPPSGLLPDVLENAYAGLASRFGFTSEIFIVDLVAVTGSLIPVGTRLEIDSGTGYYVPPILWVGTVGETGSMKSSKIRVTIEVLDELQSEAERQYQAEFETWQQAREDKDSENRSIRKPKPMDYYLSDFTFEYVAQTVSNQPNRGLIIYCDELASFFAGFDKYRRGGGDRTRWLSLYDGRSLKSNRKGDDTRIYAKATGISIVGGIQPQVLKQIMESDVACEDGLWSRFTWVRLPLTVTPAPGQDRYDLSELLEGLYRRLSTSTGHTYKLDRQAQKLWEKWHYELENLKINEPSPMLRAIYPKMKERAGRIALIAHCIHQALGEPFSEYITAERLSKAISFTQWLINQSRELYAELGISDSPETARILSFLNRFEHCKWVTPTQVRSWWNAKQKPNMADIRQFMAKVCKLGYAIDNGKQPSEKGYQIRIANFRQKASETSITANPNYDETIVRLSQDISANSYTASTSTYNHLRQVPSGCSGVIPSHSDNTLTTCDESHDNLQSHENKGVAQSSLTNHDDSFVIAETTAQKHFQEKLTKNNQESDRGNFQVGDRVRYTGKGENGLFTLKSKGLWTDILEILAIKGEYATVKLPKLISEQTIPLKDLLRA